MSKLVVQVCKIDNIEKCLNSDNLDVYTIKGWKIVSNRKDDGNGNFVPRYNIQDKVVFVPPDAILPLVLSDKLNITKYLSPVKDIYGNIIGGRVKAIRLRGQPSYGCMFEAEDGIPIDTDVAERYGITKWEPPLECTDGDGEKPDRAFHVYTSIENIGNFPNIFIDGEEVVFTEKCHGMNSRIGKIAQFDDSLYKYFVYAAGSHGVRRKEFDVNGNRSRFWEPMTDNIKKLLDHLCNDENNVIIFGEIIGFGIQDMTYGLVNARSFRVFDISVNGKYLNFDEKIKLFSEFSIEMVSMLYRGPFSMVEVEKYTSGNTTMCDPAKAGKFKGREGIVITPVIERNDPVLKTDGRVILKSISVDYLSRKNGTDSH